jgi:hypothetical protein
MNKKLATVSCRLFLPTGDLGTLPRFIAGHVAELTDTDCLVWTYGAAYEEHALKISRNLLQEYLQQSNFNWIAFHENMGLHDGIDFFQYYTNAQKNLEMIYVGQEKSLLNYNEVYHFIVTSNSPLNLRQKGFLENEVSIHSLDEKNQICTVIGCNLTKYLALLESINATSAPVSISIPKECAPLYTKTVQFATSSLENGPIFYPNTNQNMNKNRTNTGKFNLRKRAEYIYNEIVQAYSQFNIPFTIDEGKKLIMYLPPQIFTFVMQIFMDRFKCSQEEFAPYINFYCASNKIDISDEQRAHILLAYLTYDVLENYDNMYLHKYLFDNLLYYSWYAKSSSFQKMRVFDSSISHDVLDSLRPPFILS